MITSCANKLSARIDRTKFDRMVIYILLTNILKKITSNSKYVKNINECRIMHFTAYVIGDFVRICLESTVRNKSGEFKMTHQATANRFSLFSRMAPVVASILY